MIKELKYLIFILVISLFIFVTVKYYISDDNQKKSYRAFKTINEKIKLYSKKLPVLQNDTNNIIEYVKESKKKKKYNFWKLLNND
tara:strand:- start:380 stop:634 length:255 start_codon:yes stop_codon:yes gene_type:complete